MGFFDELSHLVLGGSPEGAEAAGMADLNLGNIFLPGGMRGGSANENPAGFAGFGGTPMNQTDWHWLNENWNTLRSNSNFNPDAKAHFADSPELMNGLSAGGQQFVKDNWQDIGRAANFTDINWGASGKAGREQLAQTYAPAPGAEGAGGAGGNSPLGDLEPARGMFANIAATGNVGDNSQGKILELLRQQANPFEQKAFQSINQNLFSRGRLGADDSATGEAYQGFSRGLAEADTGRQLAAFGLSDQMQNSQLQRMLGGAQGASGLTGLSTLPFDMALKLAMARSGAQLGKSQAYNQSEGDTLVDAWSKFWSFG